MEGGKVGLSVERVDKGAMSGDETEEMGTVREFGGGVGEVMHRVVGEVYDV